MAQSGFTPIQLYRTTTAAATPTAGNLADGELAINTNDGLLFYKDSGGVVGTIASAARTSGVFAPGTVSAPGLTFTGDTNTGIYSPAADTIAFTEGGVESMRIDASGNVGIGTSSPSYRIEVVASSGDSVGALRSASAGAGIQRLIGSNLEFAAFNALISTDGGGQQHWYVGGNGTANTLTFQTNGSTERMRIDASGNVGIGTSSPGARLGVSLSASSGEIGSLVRNTSTTQFAGATAVLAGPSTSSTRLSHYNGNVGGSDAVFTIQRGDANGGFSAVVYEYNYASNASIFYTNNTERMRIDASGNVGIGTTSSPADAMLTVRGSAAAARRIIVENNSTAVGTAARYDLVTGTGNSYALLTLFEDGAGGAALELAGGPAVTNGILMSSGTSIAPIIFRQQTSERMRIDASGNVGIGTSAPVNRLQVNGSFGRGAPVTKTGNFTLADTENWLICNGAGSITVTFPAASSWTGREVMIKTIAAQTVVSASSNVVPINSATAGTSILPATAGAWATLVSNGTNWVIMQS